MSSSETRPDITGQLQEAGRKLRSGHAAEAISLLQDLAKRHPDDIAVLRQLGISLAQTGHANAAEPCLARAAQLQPESAMAASDYASVLLSLNRFDTALNTLRHYENGLDANIPLADQATFWFNLGRAYKQTGRAQDAVQPLLNAIELQPQHYAALIVLGDVHKALGQADAAAARYRRAIALNAADGTGWWSLSNLKVGGFSPAEAMQLMQQGKVPRPMRQQTMFEFALANACDQLGDIDQAFAHYANGNRLARQSEPWDRQQFRYWLQILQEKARQMEWAHRPEFGASFESESAMDSRPIFIISLPRSGSTLVEQVLAAHSKVTAASELPWIPQIVAEESRRKGRSMADWIEQQDVGDWLRLGQQYLDKCQHWTRETPVFTDKLPGNLPYIGAILAMLPQALVVAVRRSAMDVCWSCYRQLLMGGSEFIYDFQSLADYWTDFESHVDFWAQQAPGRVMSLQYEHLVGNPEFETRRLLDFVGLEFEPACLSPERADRAVNTASALQVRERIHDRGIGHWQAYARHLRELQEALNKSRVV